MDTSTLTKQAIMFVDATPNEEYPLRILRAYRANCDYRYSDSTDGSETKNPMLVMMNKHQEDRGWFLDLAIRALIESSGEKPEKPRVTVDEVGRWLSGPTKVIVKNCCNVCEDSGLCFGMVQEAVISGLRSLGFEVSEKE